MNTPLMLKETPHSSSFNLLWLILDCISVVVLTLVDGFVLWKLRFKLDFSGKFTLILHYLVVILRLFDHHLNFGREVELITNLIAVNLVSYSLYYFTIEMKLMQIMLTK